MKKTITSIFMVPTLNVPKDALLNNGFLNAYVGDVDKDIQYENSVYLLFLPKDIEQFREFLDDEYERSESVIDDYDYPNGYVIIVYKLNHKFKNDYNLIKEGRYSETSKKFQELFSRVVKVKKNGLHRDHVSLQYRIFNKTEDMIEYWESKLGIEFTENLEVWDGYDIAKETLNIELITKTELV